MTFIGAIFSLVWKGFASILAIGFTYSLAQFTYQFGKRVLGYRPPFCAVEDDLRHAWHYGAYRQRQRDRRELDRNHALLLMGSMYYGQLRTRALIRTNAPADTYPEWVELDQEDRTYFLETMSTALANAEYTYAVTLKRRTNR